MTAYTQTASSPVSPDFEPGRDLGRPTPEATENILSDLLHLFRKRGWLILLVAAIGLGCGIAVYLSQPKLYTATGTIEVTEDMSSQFRVEAAASTVTGEGGVDAQKLDTEIQILSSPSLARETILALHLDSNPEFIAPKKVGKWDITKPVDRTVLVDTFLGDLSVKRVGHTSLIQVDVTTRNPTLSSVIANALVDKYIEHTFKDSFNSTQQVSVWLNSQLGDLKRNLDQSQEKLLDLQKEIGLIGSLGNTSQGQSVVIANLSELNKQLADAEVDRFLKEAVVRTAKNSPPGVIDAMAGNYMSIQYTKENLATLKAQYDSMMQTYGTAYAPGQKLKAQIDQLQAHLDSEEHSQVATAGEELKASTTNETLLRNALNAEEQDAFKNGSKAIQYELALQEYQANRELYDGLQVRLQEAGIIAGLRSSSVHIVGNAEIPAFPSSPKKALIVGGGLGAGLLIGTVLAFLFESLDTNLRTIAEIEDALQLPLLAAIPQVESENLRPVAFHEHVATGNMGSWSKIGEALRGLRTSILLSRPGAPPQVIMFTSTRPAEGKTSIAILESILFALNGSKVLLIDADLRRPTIHLRLKSNITDNKGLGLSSVLTGKATLDEAVQVWPEQPNLHILTSGPVPPLPSELVGSKQMMDMLTEARKQYDFIFVDTPPVLAVTDASLLGHITDATLLIVRYGDAQRNVVLRSVELLERSGANLLGVAINVVDYRSAGYSEYYGKKYYEYYGERPNEK